MVNSGEWNSIIYPVIYIYIPTYGGLNPRVIAKFSEWNLIIYPSWRFLWTLTSWDCTFFWRVDSMDQLSLLFKMAIDIVDLPIKNGDFNHGYVGLPEGLPEGILYWWWLEHEWMARLSIHIGNGIIIPIDFNSIIFQRGRAQPPTSLFGFENGRLKPISCHIMPGKSRLFFTL